MVSYTQADVELKLDKKGGLITVFYRALLINNGADNSAESDWIEVGVVSAPQISSTMQEKGLMLYTFAGITTQLNTAIFSRFAIKYPLSVLL